MNTNTTVTLDLCSPSVFKQWGNEAELRINQKSYPHQAGISPGNTSTCTAAGPEVGGMAEVAFIPTCQSCVQSHAVIALVLFHHTPILLLTATSSHKLYRQKIIFRDTFDL